MVGSVGTYSDLERSAAKAFVRELSRSIRSARLFQADHPSLNGMVESLQRRWDAATAGGNIELHFDELSVSLDDEQIFHAANRSEMLPGTLFEHGVVGVILKRGVGKDEARRLVLALAHHTGDEGADPAEMLWEADLRHIQVLLDSDDDDHDDDLESPETFARRMTTIGDERDSAATTEFIEFEDRGAIDPAVFRLSEAEHAELNREGASTYAATVRHLLGVLLRMSPIPLETEEGTVLETALERFIPTLAATGDMEGISEFVRHAQATRRGRTTTTGPSAVHFAEHALSIVLRDDVITSMLDGLEPRKNLRSTDLAACLADLGPASALPFARWIARTRHHEAARDAIRVLGHDAERVLIELYESGDEEERSQLRPALIEVGSHDSLAAIADCFEALPEDVRLQIVRLGDRSDAASIRQSVVLALWDTHPRIRHAAIGAVRRVDAAAVAGFVREQIDAQGFRGRAPEETTALFEMIGRVGGGDMATVLVEVCGTGGWTARFRRPTELQVRCLQAMRRMRAPDARAVVDQYHSRAPRAFRDILDTEAL